MFSRDNYDDDPIRGGEFYMPISSASTRRNEVWEKKRQKKGLKAPKATNK